MLDLYAGTGAMGIEALSRGAEQAVFVEDDPVSRQTIEANLRLCSLDSRAAVIPLTASGYLRHGHTRDRTTHMDIVFVDPPYDHPDHTQLLEELSGFAKISSNSMIIVEHFRKTLLPAQVNCLKQYRQARYGDTLLSFYRPL